jgi:hypothetical protein
LERKNKVEKRDRLWEEGWRGFGWWQGLIGGGTRTTPGIPLLLPARGEILYSLIDFEHENV